MQFTNEEVIAVFGALRGVGTLDENVELSALVAKLDAYLNANGIHPTYAGSTHTSVEVEAPKKAKKS